MRRRREMLLAALGAAGLVITVHAFGSAAENDAAVVAACAAAALEGVPLLAEQRAERFQGKVDDARARCRGGERAAGRMDVPWVDWSNYWAAGSLTSRSDRRDTGSHIFDRNQRGIDGALFDL